MPVAPAMKRSVSVVDEAKGRMSDLVSPMSVTLERAPMLTIIGPNSPVLNIKTLGSESRTASMHQLPEAQLQAQQAQAAAQAGGVDEGVTYAHVNAETATAVNRTILQTLALAVATQLGLTRQQGERMDDFFLRIAEALRQLPRNGTLELEIKAALKAFNIQLSDLVLALKQPDGALAARLVARMEAPQAAPQKAAAAAATTTYLEPEAASPRSAEALAMSKQAQAGEGRLALFSPSARPAPPRPETSDPRNLQAQLKNLFEPGASETRKEIQGSPKRAEDVGRQAPRENVDAKTAGRELRSALSALVAGVDKIRAELLRVQGGLTASLPAEKAEHPAGAAVSGDEVETHEARPAVREEQAGRNASANAGGKDQRNGNSVEPRAGETAGRSNAQAARNDMQMNQAGREERQALAERNAAKAIETLATTRALSELLASAETDMTEQAPLVAARQMAKALPGAQGHGAEQGADELTPEQKEAAARAAAVNGAGKEKGQIVTADRTTAEEARKAAASASDAAAAQQAAARGADAEKLPVLRMQMPDPVPFAFAALQPAQDEFETELPETRGRQDDEEAAEEEGEKEDPEARRERLARKATDDLLRPEAEEEPEIRLTRDSSQADRAYVFYQKMAGF